MVLFCSPFLDGFCNFSSEGLALGFALVKDGGTQVCPSLTLPSLGYNFPFNLSPLDGPTAAFSVLELTMGGELKNIENSNSSCSITISVTIWVASVPASSCSICILHVSFHIPLGVDAGHLCLPSPAVCLTVSVVPIAFFGVGF